MYSRIKIRNQCPCGVLMRYLSSAEISTALRPFYFSVHPDLFGKFPAQRKVNESSLQQLSALLEAQQSSRTIKVPPLSFYLRQKDSQEGEFKHVKIHLTGNTVRDTVIKVLNACDISTKYVEKIPRSNPVPENIKIDFEQAYQEYSSEFENIARMKRNVEAKRAHDNIIDWLTHNSAIAKEKYESTRATREQVKTLSIHLCKTYGIKEVKWDNGWNISHIRGALQSLVELASQHSRHMSNLKDRNIVLGQFTGVSLDGEVFLNIIDVRNEWLSLIKNVQQQDGALATIPDYEETLSSILRNIHVSRRKFMPKVSATQYCSHLRQLITSFGDFYGRGSKVPGSVPDSLSKYEIVVEPKFMPKVSATQYCSHLRQLITSFGDFYGRGSKVPGSVPDSLSKYEIVVEPEAGPLMLSPTGQFITPSSCPADELIYFIAKHLDEATLLLTEYSINKHVEKALYKEVKERFNLLELHKDDSVTPALMILCCQRLLTRIDRLNTKLRGNILNITHYYSVLSEGVLCIPWNFK